MFYSSELFGRKGTDLGNIWIAGTLGSKKLSRAAILKYNLARLCLSVRNPELILALPTQSTLLRGVVRIEQKQTSFLYIDALDTRTRLVTLNADADHDSHTSGSLDSSANLQTSASDAEAGLHGKTLRAKQALKNAAKLAGEENVVESSMGGTLGSLGPVLVASEGSLRHLDAFLENALDRTGEGQDDGLSILEQFIDVSSIHKDLYDLSSQLPEDSLHFNADATSQLMREQLDDVNQLLLAEGIDLSEVSLDPNFQAMFFGEDGTGEVTKKPSGDDRFHSFDAFEEMIQTDIRQQIGQISTSTAADDSTDAYDISVFQGQSEKSAEHTEPSEIAEIMDSSLDFQQQIFLPPNVEAENFLVRYPEDSLLAPQLLDEEAYYDEESFGPDATVSRSRRSRTVREHLAPDNEPYRPQTVVLKPDRSIEISDQAISSNLTSITTHTINRAADAYYATLESLDRGIEIQYAQSSSSSATSAAAAGLLNAVAIPPSEAWGTGVSEADVPSPITSPLRHHLTRSRRGLQSHLHLPPAVRSLLIPREERLASRYGATSLTSRGSTSSAHLISTFQTQMEERKDISRSVRLMGPILGPADAAARVGGISSLVTGTFGPVKGVRELLCPVYNVTTDMYRLALTNLQTRGCLEEDDEQETAILAEIHGGAVNPTRIQHQERNGGDVVAAQIESEFDNIPFAQDVGDEERSFDTSFGDVELGRRQASSVVTSNFLSTTGEYNFDYLGDSFELQDGKDSVTKVGGVEPGLFEGVSLLPYDATQPQGEGSQESLADSSIQLVSFQDEDLPSLGQLNQLSSQDFSLPIDTDIDTGFDGVYPGAEGAVTSDVSLNLHHIGRLGMAFYWILSRAFAEAERIQTKDDQTADSLPPSVKGLFTTLLLPSKPSSSLDHPANFDVESRSELESEDEFVPLKRSKDGKRKSESKKQRKNTTRSSKASLSEPKSRDHVDVDHQTTGRSVLHVDYAKALEFEVYRHLCQNARVSGDGQSVLQALGFAVDQSLTPFISIHDVSGSFVQLLHLRNLDIVEFSQSSPYSRILIRKGIYWDQPRLIQQQQQYHRRQVPHRPATSETASFSTRKSVSRESSGSGSESLRVIRPIKRSLPQRVGDLAEEKEQTVSSNHDIRNDPFIIRPKRSRS